MNNDTGQDQGGAGSPSLDNPDLGNQGGEGNQPAVPSGQDGQQTDTGNAELEQLRANNRALNKALIESRRGQRQQPQGQGGEDSPFDTPEGQYAISLEVATGQLSRKLEDIYSLYPEIPASEVARIRRNPWAFASFESYKSGDVETALLEVEQALVDRVNELGQTDNQGSDNADEPKVTPATINPNQPAEQGVEAASGSAEDENPWTMPIDKLEQKAKKQLAQTKP